MQTDLGTLSRETIKSIVKKNPLSEEQAQILIDKEQNGRGRKRVMEFLALQARKARADLNLRHAQFAGIHLPTVLLIFFMIYQCTHYFHPCMVFAKIPCFALAMRGYTCTFAGLLLFPSTNSPAFTCVRRRTSTC